MLIIRVVALVCLIVSLASAQLPVPGSVGGGSGTAAPPYAKAFTAVTTITATAVQHGMGTTAIPGDCYDNGTPAALVTLTAGFPQRAANGDITWAWTGSKTGTCYVWNASASGTAGGDLTGNYPNPTLNITVPVNKGGTGKSSWTQYSIPYASTATVISEIPIGTAGQCLQVNGTTNGYTWGTCGSGGGGTWGSITGTLSSQTDLQTALNLKAPLAGPTFTGTVTGTFSGNLTGAVTGNASTATALAADPAACTAGQYVSDIAANGTLTCGTPAGGGGGGSPNTPQTFTSQTSVTITHNANSLATITQCYDGSNAKIEPLTVTRGLNSNVVTFSSATTGGCVVNSSGGGVGSSIGKPFTTAQYWVYPYSEHGIASCDAAITVFISGDIQTPLRTRCAPGVETVDGQSLVQYDRLVSWNSTQSGRMVLTSGSGGGTGSGDVVGPSSATDNAVARFDTTTGKLVQNSGVTIDDSANISTAGSISVGAGGSTAGYLELGQGTAPSAGTTSVRVYAPTSVTSYKLRVPGAAGTGFRYGVNTAGDVVESFSELSGDVSTTGSAATVLATKYKTRMCEIHIWGSGASSVLQDADDEAASCFNGFGVTETITAVRCWANAGTPTVTPIVTGGGATSILTGALTCGTASFASGTLNGTPTLSSLGSIDANVTTAGGTATNIRLVFTLTR
jgi:hypothetical protein